MAEAWAVKTAQARVREHAGGFHVLRAHGAEGAAFAAGVGAPATPNTVSPARIAWLGPSEWALLDWPAADAGDLAMRAGAGVIAHLSDLSAATRRYRVEGARARDLIASGCSLDLHPSAFAEGACARSLLAQTDVLIVAAAADGFDIYADASLAAHLRAWFGQAAHDVAF